MEGQIEMADKTKTDAKAQDPAEEARKVADAAKEAEAAEAPEEVEAGEETGMKALVTDLHDRRRRAKLGGGEQKIALQHERGKLTARERIDLLVDPGTFVEIGIQAGPHSSQRAMEGKEAPADGVITGWGDVDGRRCAHRRSRMPRPRVAAVGQPAVRRNRRTSPGRRSLRQAIPRTQT